MIDPSSLRRAPRVCSLGVLIIVTAGGFALAAEGSPDDAAAADVRAAAGRVIAAVGEGDAGAARAMIDGGQEAGGGELAGAVAEALVAADALADAAVERYGVGAREWAGRMVEPADARELERAVVEVRGDAATVTFRQSVRPMRFRKVDGGWKLVIDQAEYVGEKPGGAARQVELLRKTAAAMTDAAGRVRAGEFATAEAARETIERRLHEVMIEHHRGAAAAAAMTTRPATTPATSTPRSDGGR